MGILDSINDAVGGVVDAVGDVASGIGDLGQDVFDEIQRFGRDINDEWLRFTHKLFGIPDLDDLLSQFEGVLLNHDGATSNIGVLYGSSRIGGYRAAPPIVTGANNEYVHLFIIHSEGPISGYARHYLDDVLITDPRFAGQYRLKTYTGAPGQQADPDALAEIPGWTANHKFEGLAYSYIRLKWDQDAFGGIPTVTTYAAGRTLYDPRNGLTTSIGNPALVALDYLTHPIYGKGVPLARIDTAAFDVAADYYDESVVKHSGTTDLVSRGRVNGLLDTGREILANLRQLAGEFGFEIIEPKTAGGLWSIQVNKDEPSAYSFTEANIFGQISVTEGGRRGRLNRLSARYRDSSLEDQPNDIVFDSPALRAEDNGRVLESQVPLQYTTLWYRAYSALERMVKISRNQIGCAFLTDLGVLAVTEGTVVDVSYPDYGWDAKLFRIARLKLLNSAMVMVTLTEHEPTAYDETVPPEQPTPPDTNLPDPWTVLPPTGVSIGTGTVFSLLGSSPWVQTPISWTVPADAFVRGYFVEWKRSEDPTYVPGASVDGQSTTSVDIFVPAATEIDVRITAINSNSVRSSAATASGTTAAVTPPGAPGDPLASIRSADAQVTLEWPVATPGSLAVARYVVWRAPLGESFEDAALVGTVDGTTVTLAEPDGLWAYWVQASDGAGNLGPESAQASVDVQSLLRLLWRVGQYIKPHQAPASTRLGQQVSLNGGASLAAVATDTGQVWMFDGANNMLIKHAEINTADIHSGTFGDAIDLADFDRRVAIGASEAQTASVSYGAVYIHAGDLSGAWPLEQKIVASDKEAADLFGRAVSMDAYAERLAVGASGADSASLSAIGAVYIFSRSGTVWTEDEILLADVPTAVGGFGRVLSMSGDGLTLAVVGSIGASQHSVYIFTDAGTGFSQDQRIDLPADALDIDLDFFGDRLIVASNSGEDSQIWERSAGTFALAATLTEVDVPSLGCGMSQFGNIAGIGGTDAYFYVRGSAGWRLSRQVIAPAQSSAGFFGGFDFSADARHALVGAALDFNGSVLAGAAILLSALSLDQ